MHKSSMENMKLFVEKYFDPNKKLTILDIGSQVVNEESYKSIITNPNWKYIGCDIMPGNNVDVVLKNMYNWKEIKSNSVDVIISGQAFEHIEFFWATMLEVGRALKPGGICCIIAPSSGVCHRYPLDCWRYYEDGMSAMAKYAGLHVLSVQTQRTRFDFKEFDPMWQDSVLIATKSTYKFSTKVKMKMKYVFNHFLIRDIYEVNRKIPECTIAQLFYTQDGEYCEQNSITQSIEISEDNYKVYFSFDKIDAREKIKSIRFDPADKSIKYKHIKALVTYLDEKTEDLEIKSTNGELIDEFYVYEHNDPTIYFDCMNINFEKIDYISFEAIVKGIGD